MRHLALGLLLLLLAACGAATPTTGSDSTGATAPAVDTPVTLPATSPEASDAALPPQVPQETATSIGVIGGSNNGGAADEVERQALAVLARQLNQPVEAFQLQNKEAVEWSDGSLGCAQPDMMYTQVITPGYKLTYSDGAQTYVLHTNETGSQVVWCENGKPKEIGQP